MKKVLSILLSLTLVFSLCSVIANAEEAEPDISFAVASDLHYEKPEEELTWYSEDPIYGYANRRAAMENESGLIIDEFLNQCAEDDSIQFVLISGDICNNGRANLEDHYTVAEKFHAFEEETGKQIYVINGNHDSGIVDEGCTTGMEEFKEVYAEFGYDQALTTVETDCSYTANLDEKYRLIALDSCDYTKSTEDGMTDEKVQWVIDQAELALEEGRYPILMMHHNLLDHLPMQRILSRNFIIKNHFTTAEKWANAGIKLVFTGHEHCSDATSYTSTLGNVISDFATTSLTMYPLQYRYIEMTDDAITYEAKTIDNIDTDALRAYNIGYSEDQLAEMDKGLNDFSKNYLKNGVEYRLERGFNDEQLGIAPGDIYYSLVRNAIDALNGVLNAPLYGEGGVQELAASYGIEIPDSDYVDGWDVATELVAAHYAGSEDYPLTGTEVTILLRTVSVILKTELKLFTDDEFTAAAAAILGATGAEVVPEAIEIISNQQGVSAGEYFLLAITAPLLDEFANDDGVDDNNGSIAGYGKTSTEDNLSNIGANLSGILAKIAKYLDLVFTVVLKMLGAAK